MMLAPHLFISISYTGRIFMTLETQDAFSISFMMAPFTRLGGNYLYNSYLFLK